MREILFRAKQIDNGELIEGCYVKLCWNGKELHAIIQENTELYSGNTIDSIIDIDPETLCRYTELKDKNGNRIWENDIVSCEHEKYPDDNPLEVYPLMPDPIKYKRNYAVEFINTGSSYGYRLRNKSIHFMLTANVIYNHKIEVLGNVFDNPELLKDEENDHVRIYKRNI